MLKIILAIFACPLSLQAVNFEKNLHMAKNPRLYTPEQAQKNLHCTECPYQTDDKNTLEKHAIELHGQNELMVKAIAMLQTKALSLRSSHMSDLDNMDENNANLINSLEPLSEDRVLMSSDMLFQELHWCASNEYGFVIRYSDDNLHRTDLANTQDNDLQACTFYNDTCSSMNPESNLEEIAEQNNIPTTDPLSDDALLNLQNSWDWIEGLSYENSNNSLLASDYGQYTPMVVSDNQAVELENTVRFAHAPVDGHLSSNGTLNSLPDKINDDHLALSKNKQKDGRNKLKCSTCNYLADIPSVLIKHQRIHTGEKPFICSFANCTYASAFNYAVLRHQRTVHSDARPFQCSICAYAAKEGGALTKHIQTRHAKKNDE